MGSCSKDVVKKRGTPRLPVAKNTAGSNAIANERSGFHRGSSVGNTPLAGPASELPSGATGNAEETGCAQQTQSQAGPVDLWKEKTVTVKEAAYRLKKSEDTIYLWFRTGRLKGWQPGGRRCAVLVTEASVEKALRAR